MLPFEERRILLYVPNLIGYVRAGCLVVCWWAVGAWPALALAFYCLQAVLDAVDGWAARRLHQASTFGAWLDVAVDNSGRAMIWSLVWRGGWLVASLEWLCFVCNSSAGGRWKEELIAAGPLLCRRVMENGFYQPWGALAVAGLHVLPIWLMALQHDLLARLPVALVWASLAVLVAGRLLAASVELWCLWAHVRGLLRADIDPAQQQSGHKH